MSITRKATVAICVGLLTMASAAPAFADNPPPNQPPGQLGYEGQPGNQGGGGGQPPGCLGYEGHPGNQGC
jgi:hypothetical protein